MNLDDLFCTGAEKNFLLSQTIGRNKNLIPGEIIKTIIEGTQENIDYLKHLDLNIQFGGGETADIGDLVRTIHVDSTMCTRLPKSEIIDNSKIKENLVVIGFSSSNKSTYESTYNSGIGSNGLTSARHDILDKSLRLFTESYDPLTNKELIYSGTKLLQDNISGLSLNIGQLLLSPTRTYSPILKKIFKELKSEIKGIIHCTGGGQTKVKKFIKEVEVIKDNLFTTPPIFNLIMKESSSTLQEMYKVFNMGHRLEIYVEEKWAKTIIDISNSFDVEAKIIGRTIKSKTSKVTIISEREKLTF